MKDARQMSAKAFPGRMLLCLAVACLSVPLVSAQSAPATVVAATAASLPPGLRGAVSLDGPWRFQAGDDPQWSGVAFDDSHWLEIKPGKSLNEQGIESYTGFAWYRLRVSAVVLPGSQAPSLLVVPFSVGEMQVFANGVDAASTPGMADRRDLRVMRSFSVQLPQPAADGTYEIAIRTWVSLPVHRGLVERVEIGDTQSIASLLALAEGKNWDENVFSGLIASFLFLAVAILGATLYAAQRNHLEYLWLALLCLTVAAMGSAETAFSLGYLPLSIFHIISLWAGRIFMAVTLEFVLRFTADQNGRFIRGLQAFALLVPILSLAHLARIYEYTSISLQVAFCSVVIVMLYRAWRRGRSEAGVMLVPFFLAGTADSIDTLLDYAASLHRLPDRFHSHRHFFGPVAFTTSTFTFLVFLGSLIAVILYRFVHVSQEEQRSAAELEAARSVQTLLIPTQLPSNQHFVLEGAYLPANGVGGDFFQVLPQHDGSMLVVVGDVSGKGLRAAMNASTLVGALRNETSLEPSTVLNHLNQVMLGALSGANAGFATCVCARVHPDGRMIVANAGHLNPYRDGREMVLAPDLPLGIVPNMAYEQAEFQLEPGVRLIFLSDGVVEATNPQGELFGFERTQHVSNESAQYIAQTAQRFGQNDDITVVSVYFAAQAAHRHESVVVSTK